MINPDKWIRKAFVDALAGLQVNGKPIPVYDSHTPRNDAAFIVLSTQSGYESRRVKCLKTLVASITVDIVTRYAGNSGSQLFADDIKEAVLNLTENLEITNFVKQGETEREFPYIAPLTTTTETIFRKLIIYNFKIS